MIKYLLLFLFWATASFAQMCPTRPAGDSSNACASTAFVGAAITAEATANPAVEEVSPMSPPYNAYCDVRNVTGATSITSGANVLTLVGAGFTSADVGKHIIIPGAGVTPGGATGPRNLETTITGYTSSTQVTLADNASATLTASSRRVSWGHDDTSVFQTLLTNARAIVLPPRTCFVGGVTQATVGASIRGAGQASVIQKLSMYSNWAISGNYNTFRDFNYDGSWTSALNLGTAPAANFSVSGAYNRFFNVQSYWGGRCWEIGNATQGVAVNNEITSSVCHDVTDVGISQSQHTQGQIHHNLIYNTALEAVTTDVFSHRTLVESNAAYNTGLYGGVAVFGWDGGHDVKVINNYVSGSPLPCLAIASNSGNSLNGIIAGNRCTGTAGGIHLIYFNGPDVGWGTGPYYPQNTLITGNVLDSTAITGFGLRIDTGVTGTRVGTNTWAGGTIIDSGNSTIYDGPANSYSRTKVVTTTATLTLGDCGSLVTTTASGPYTVTLPVIPGAAYPLCTLEFWNNSAQTITLAGQSSQGFYGPKGSGGATTMTMSAGTTLQLRTDGTNWIALRF